MFIEIPLFVSSIGLAAKLNFNIAKVVYGRIEQFHKWLPLYHFLIFMLITLTDHIWGSVLVDIILLSFSNHSETRKAYYF